MLVPDRVNIDMLRDYTKRVSSNVLKVFFGDVSLKTTFEHTWSYDQTLNNFDSFEASTHMSSYQHIGVFIGTIEKLYNSL